MNINNTAPDSCCRGCQERWPLCHIFCKRYLREEAANQKKRDARNLEKQVILGVHDQQQRAIHRMTRKPMTTAGNRGGR